MTPVAAAAGRVATLAVLLTSAGACSLWRARPPASTQPERPAIGGATSAACEADCGPRPANPLHSRVGECEGTLNDLCRARCMERMGDSSAALRQQIAGLEEALEHACGSGEPIEPGDFPTERPSRPAEPPLDRLLHGS